LAAAWLLAGCASFGEGVTRALLAPSDEAAEDTRLCEVSGPAFAGILPLLERQAGGPPLGQAGPERPILKVIMVHGVGSGQARLEPVGFTVPPMTRSRNVAAADTLANRCSSMATVAGYHI
jgi:hypothetical protein